MNARLVCRLLVASVAVLTPFAGIAAAAPSSATAPIIAVNASAANKPDLTPEQVAKLGWDALPEILSHIQAPTFPNRNFLITDFGAKPDGETDSTEAIAKAIQACHAAGGGHVQVPDGVFMTGSIHLLSNVDLHLADNATLRFIQDLDKYLPLVQVRYEGVEYMNFSPPIYAFEQENIGVTGKGTLDGGTQRWWSSAVSAGQRRGAAPAATPGAASTPAGAPLASTGGTAGSRGIPAASLPVAERIRGPGGGLRPNFVQPYRSRNIIIEGLTIINSPMWEINPVFCTNVIVRNLNINSHGANNDGCNPDSCKYVLIEGCTFDTGDDCIAIKCGKDDDGRRVNIPSEFIVIRNCVMKDGHGGVTLGSECTPGIRNVFVYDCKMDSPQLNAVLRFKNNPARGGVIENVFAKNLDVGRVAAGNNRAAFLIEFTYMNGQGPYVPVLRNVSASNIKGAIIPRLVSLTKGPTAIIENFQISDSTFSGPNREELEQNQGIIKFTNVAITP